MKLLTGLFDSLKLAMEALAFIRRHRKLHWFLLPTIILLGMFMGGFELSSWLSTQISTSIKLWLTDFIDVSAWPDILFYVFWILIRIMLFLMLSYLGGYVVLLLMAPYLSWVSMQTHRLSGGTDTPFLLSAFLRETLSSLMITTRNLFMEILATIALFGLGFIPLFTPFVPFALFGVSAWFYGFSLVQPVFERRQLSVSQSRQAARQNAGLVFGLGSQFTLLLSIPFLGVLFCAFLSVILTVAGTLGLRETPQELSR
jgi:CysZ protein